MSFFGQFSLAIGFRSFKNTLFPTSKPLSPPAPLFGELLRLSAITATMAKQTAMTPMATPTTIFVRRFSIRLVAFDFFLSFGIGAVA